MSANPRTLDSMRPMDAVIEERIDLIQRAAFRASAVVESVRQILLVNNSESIGGTSAGTLADALELAMQELGDVTDRLDLVNLRDKSEQAISRTAFRKIADAA